MKPVKHILNDVWNKYPEALSNSSKSAIEQPKLERIFADIFTVGSYYYYVIDVPNSLVSNFNSDILKMHPLKEYPQHLKEIIDLIHPDDLQFVVKAEAWTLEIYHKIGYEHQLHLKVGYCFRMLVDDNKFELFHHQALHTAKDNNGVLVQALNIHTNINHITTINNYIATVSGIGYRKDFYQKKFNPDEITNEHLTKRELEILLLLTKNFNDKEIADMLFLSYHTVRTHHKNILRKTNSKNSFELLKHSLENGYL